MTGRPLNPRATSAISRQPRHGANGAEGSEAAGDGGTTRRLFSGSRSRDSHCRDSSPNHRGHSKNRGRSGAPPTTGGGPAPAIPPSTRGDDPEVSPGEERPMRISP